MRRLTRRTTALLSALALAGGLAACGNPIDAALDFGLEGTWKNIDGLAIEFDGNQAVVTDFGSSPLGTNSSVFHTGQPFIKDISCDENACTGQIVDPEIVDGILQGIGFEGVTIETNGDQITMRRKDDGETSTFTKVASDPGTGGSGTLATSASCSQWWTALKAGSPWRLTEIHKSSYTGAPTQDAQITFVGTNQYQLTNPGQLGTDASQGTIDFDDKIFGTDFCRFSMWSASGEWAAWFMKSLGNGQLRVNLSSSSEVEYLLFQSN